MLLRWARRLVLPVVYGCMAYQFLRYYVSMPFFYLRLPFYFSGHERLPFQFRVLPILFLEPLRNNHLLQSLAAGRTGPLHNPDRLAFLLLSMLSMAAIVYFCTKLYQALSTTRRMQFLLFPLLLFVLLWTYVIHIEADFSYPYDLPSLAFFTAGLYYVYQRRFAPFALVVLLGTFNRETTLFLIGIYILDMASLSNIGSSTPFRARFNRSLVPWARVALLCVLWFAVKASLAFAFRWNDRSEDHLRLGENLARLIRPNYWPAALNVGGYLFPFVLLFRTQLRSQRFANYLYILVPWFLIMLVDAVIVETRIYGELSCYFTVAGVLLFEGYVEGLGTVNVPVPYAEPERPLQTAA